MLSSAVDVSVTVNALWTRVDGFMKSEIAQCFGNTSYFISMIMIRSLGEDQAGLYNCTAIVSSTTPLLTGVSSLSGFGNVTIGKQS